MRRGYFYAFGASCVLSFCIAGCGGSSSDFVFETRVSDVSLRDQTTPPGGTNSVRVELSVGNVVVGRDVDNEDILESEAFSLIVRLPQGASFVIGTSKLSDSILGDTIFGNPDKRAPNALGTCPDGSSYVAYEFDQDELGDPSAIDNANIYIKFDIQIQSIAEGELISAGVEQFLPSDPCTANMEDSTQILVAS